MQTLSLAASLRAAPVLALAAAALLSPCTARAHEVLHAIERDRAVAVHAWETDGDPLADAQYEVYAPSDPRTPWVKGRTDRNGWFAFVAGAPGRWRIRVMSDDGHGFEDLVDAAAAAPSPAAPTVATLLLRPVAGALALVAIFGVLFLVYRRRGRP